MLWMLGLFCTRVPHSYGHCLVVKGFESIYIGFRDLVAIHRRMSLLQARMVIKSLQGLMETCVMGEAPVALFVICAVQCGNMVMLMKKGALYMEEHAHHQLLPHVKELQNKTEEGIALKGNTYRPTLGKSKKTHVKL